ncbi:MAG: OsmC family protein [Chloroflexi bacterium]|nr:OsmC family protein [Chloroflexota bacterium]MCL5074941.1 OsmC family protein [Chloroflexota bacterium]
MRVTLRQIEGMQFLGVANEHALVIDQGLDGGGQNTGFRPTELLLLALGACMMANIVGLARNQEFQLGGLELALEDEVLLAPTRISQINITMKIADGLSDKEKMRLVRSAEHCKIHNTLSTPPRINLSVV